MIGSWTTAVTSGMAGRSRALLEGAVHRLLASSGQQLALQRVYTKAFDHMLILCGRGLTDGQGPSLAQACRGWSS
jgi:hypothetical protein